NKNRKRTERKAIGRRGDAIIRKCIHGRTLEFGGAEAGRFFDGENGTKWLVESGLKLPKMLRDMFVGLCERVSWRPEVVRRLETIGYIHGGMPEVVLNIFLCLRC